MNKPELALLSRLYDDVELAILFDWLELPRPEHLHGLDLQIDAESSAGAIRPMLDYNGEESPHMLDNAVARLLLSGIQHRLPQWMAVFDEGVITARKYTPHRQGTLQVVPVFLFAINWADSGPGYSWPETYRAWLPGFDRYVVTASQDSPEMHGYTDEAIGHFAGRSAAAVAAGVHTLITGWWQHQLDGWNQQRFAYLLDCGEIDASTVATWADAVWGP